MTRPITPATTTAALRSTGVACGRTMIAIEVTRWRTTVTESMPISMTIIAIAIGRRRRPPVIIVRPRLCATARPPAGGRRRAPHAISFDQRHVLAPM
jgi:hypothetical protein